MGGGVRRQATSHSCGQATSGPKAAQVWFGRSDYAFCSAAKRASGSNNIGSVSAIWLFERSRL